MAETKLLSPERVKEITERVEKATAGPWKVRQYDGGHRGVDVAEPKDWQTTVFAPHVQYDGYGSGGASDANSAFIAASRTDIPDLLTERELLVGIVRKHFMFAMKARHLDSCSSRKRSGKKPCDCGLVDILSDETLLTLLKEQG